MKNLLDSNQYAFLYFLQYGLNGSSSWAAPTEFSFESIFTESINQQLTGIMYDGILKSGFVDKVPQELRNKWKEKAMMNYMFVERIMNAQNEILKKLSDSGIKCVVLKGSSVSAYYSTPCLRAQGDIDLFVKREQIDICLDLLRNMGYEDEEDHSDHHLNVQKDNILIEVHYTLGSVPDKKTAEKIDSLFACFDNSVGYIDCLGYSIPVLSPALQATSLLIHIIQHMTAAGIGFRQICDWAFWTAACADEKIYSECVDLLKQLGIYKFACIISHFCRTWLGCDIHFFDEYTPDLKELHPLLCDIFDGGDFGKKDMNRYRSRFLFSNSAEKHGFLGRIFQSVRSMHHIAVLRHPIFNKCLILRPFAFLCIPCGYIFRILTGRNDKSTLKKSIDIAKKRTAIYEKMDLFK